MRNLWAVFFIQNPSGGTAAFNPISGGDYGYGGKIPHRADEFRAGTGRALQGSAYSRASGERDGMNGVLPEVYLARHGDTAWSFSGQHTGLTDVPLTLNGERNARNLGNV